MSGYKILLGGICFLYTFHSIITSSVVDIIQVNFFVNK